MKAHLFAIKIMTLCTLKHKSSIMIFFQCYRPPISLRLNSRYGMTFCQVGVEGINFTLSLLSPLPSPLSLCSLSLSLPFPPFPPLPPPLSLSLSLPFSPLFWQVADVGCAVHLCSLLHRRYAEFSPLLMDQLQKIYSIQIKNDDDRSTSVTKYRLGLRLLGEVRGGGRERERERERGGGERKRERE